MKTKRNMACLILGFILSMSLLSDLSIDVARGKGKSEAVMTSHAKLRCDERLISQKEIAEVLSQGKKYRDSSYPDTIGYYKNNIYVVGQGNVIITAIRDHKDPATDSRRWISFEALQQDEMRRQAALTNAQKQKMAKKYFDVHVAPKLKEIEKERINKQREIEVIQQKIGNAKKTKGKKSKIDTVIAGLETQLSLLKQQEKELQNQFIAISKK